MPKVPDRRRIRQTSGHPRAVERSSVVSFDSRRFQVGHAGDRGCRAAEASETKCKEFRNDAGEIPRQVPLGI